MKSCWPAGDSVRPGEPDGSRRADWRFLVPAGPACEPAVIRQPQRDQLEKAFLSLPPGGVCYLEWPARLRPRARSLARRIEDVGFVAVRLYWSSPRDNPSLWVPLDEPATFRWVLRRERARRLTYRVWRTLLAFGLVRPRCGTAVRPPVADHLGPLGAPLDGLGARPVWALLAPGGDPLNKLLAFVGSRGSHEPSLVLKLPRTTAAATGLQCEAASLQALEVSGKRPQGVPRLLFSYHDGGELRALAESPLRGRPLFEKLDRRSYPTLARQATDWLIEFAVSTRSERRTQNVAQLAADVAMAAKPGDRPLIIAARRVAAAAELLPIVFEQRDFSPWNLHIAADGSLIVYDWESAEQAGFPGLDLVYLLAYCGFFLDEALEPGRASSSYRATFAAGGVAGECLSRYCRALEIDPTRLPALRALTWLVHLRSALRRDSDGATTALFLDLLREEVNGGGNDRAEH
jgi:hypothetical protein